MSRKRPQPTPSIPVKAPITWPEASSLLILALVFLIPLIGGYVLMEPYGASSPWVMLINMFGIEKDLTMAVGISLGLVGLAYLLHKPTQFPGRHARHAVVLAIMAGWVLVCAALSPYHADALRQAGGWLAALAVIALVSRLNGTSRQWLMAALAVAGSMVAFLAVREYMSNLRGSPEWRVFGPFQSPNILAAYLCLTIPLTLGWLSRELRADLRMLAMIGWGLQVSALVLTGSRFGLLSAVVGIAVWLVWMLVRKQWDRATILRVTRAVAFALILAVACTGPLRNRMGAAPAAGAQEHSGQFRQMTWKGALNMVKAHPVVGVGPGCFAHGYSRTAITGYTRTAHQSYLQMASEMGVPGLLLWLGIGLGGIVVLLRSRQSDIPVPLLAGVAAGIVASSCHAMMDSDWQILTVLLTLSVLVGLCYIPGKDGIARQPKLLFNRSMAAVALLAGAWICLQAYHAQIGQYAMQSGDAATALASYDSILAACPFDGAAMMNKAIVQASNPAVSADAKVALLDAACKAMPTPRNFMMSAKVAESLTDMPGYQMKAAGYYQKLIEVDPVSPRGYVRYGDLLERMGRYTVAKVIYRRLVALEKSPAGQIRAVPELPETDYAFGYGGLARLAARDGDKMSAAAKYKEALRVIADDREARTHNVAMSAAKPREMSEQLDVLEREAKGWLSSDR